MLDLINLQKLEKRRQQFWDLRIFHIFTLAMWCENILSDVDSYFDLFEISAARPSQELSSSFFKDVGIIEKELLGNDFPTNL